MRAKTGCCSKSFVQSVTGVFFTSQVVAALLYNCMSAWLRQPAQSNFVKFCYVLLLLFIFLIVGFQGDFARGYHVEPACHGLYGHQNLRLWSRTRFDVHFTWIHSGVLIERNEIFLPIPIDLQRYNISVVHRFPGTESAGSQLSGSLSSCLFSFVL
jgi:hypothetical protein